jgi:hypothetical protein
MSRANNYGSKFFAVETETETDMVFADRAECRDGVLMLHGGFRKENETALSGAEIILAAYAPGCWRRVSAASVIDGHAVAIDSTNKKSVAKHCK